MRFIGLSLPLQKVPFLFLENGVVLTQLCGSSAFKVATRIDFQWRFSISKAFYFSTFSSNIKLKG
jgi:hypothetical protein